MRSRTSPRAAAVAACAVILALGTTLLAACGSTEPRNLIDSIKSGSVILGTKYDQPGLGQRNPDRSVTGFDPTVSTFVVNHIADELGVPHPKITWRETPSAQRETLINNGEVDMIAATYSINAARSKKVDFAGPYLINYQGLLVRSDDDSIQNLTDLENGKKLCSVTGSTPAQNVKKQLPAVQLQEYDSYSSCVEGLRRGKVDALTTDEVILAGYSNFWPGEFKLVDMTYPKDYCGTKDYNGETVPNFIKAGTPFSTERYGIGMAKGQPESVAAVNEALRLMMEPPGPTSPWQQALRTNIGAANVDKMIARAATGDTYKFTPTPGDLKFVTPTPGKPCPAGMK